MRINLCEIILADENPADKIKRVQLLKAGKYKYYDESTLEISTDMLSKMKVNFDNRVKKNDLAIDYYHMAYGEAAGWITGVTLENGGTELWIEVEWTDEAKEKILAKKVKYLSADFDLDYMDNETGEKHGPTLNGGGLTNRPFIKGMQAILSEISAIIDKSPEKIDDIKKLLSETQNKGQEIMTFEELKKALVTAQLSDDQKKEVVRLIGVEDRGVKLSEEVVSLKAQIKAKDEEIAENAKKLAEVEKKSQFSKLLSEGKAVPAQEDAYMKGDMAEFARLSVPMNSKPTGSGADPKTLSDAPKTAEEAEDKIIQLAVEKRKANTALSVEASTALVLAENPELKKLLTA